jgi:hypothetical protein
MKQTLMQTESKDKDLNKVSSGFSCWVCESREIELVKRSNIEKEITSNLFAISDSNYGTTGELHRCKKCGFLQCFSFEEVLPYYENLEDPSYEAGREERAIQAKKILNTTRKYQPNGRLLDIGAASGILVEQAIEMGYNAEGIEPSKWLHNLALERNLPVHLGTFPHTKLTGPYDIVTIIDIIEHVSNPIELLNATRGVLSENGIVVVVTPNVKSLIARLLGNKWWHFRVAHIGYFSKQNLNMLMTRAGFRLIKTFCPSWYFPADYLLKRVNTYLPSFIKIPIPSFVKNITIPLNLRDSILGIYRISPRKQNQQRRYF